MPEEEEEPSDHEWVRQTYAKDLIVRELAFCDKVNKYHPRNYYQWTYRLKLVENVVKPLIRQVAIF